jgi:hypothetical protein
MNKGKKGVIFCLAHFSFACGRRNLTESGVDREKEKLFPSKTTFLVTHEISGLRIW